MNSTPRYQQQATSTAMNAGSAKKIYPITAQRHTHHREQETYAMVALFYLRLAVSGSSRSWLWALPLYCVYDGQTLSTSLHYHIVSIYNIIINHVRNSRPTWHPQGPSRLGNLHRYNIRGSQPHPIRFT